MAKKVVAIVGTYRKGKVTDSAVDAVLRGAEAAGAQTEKIYLIDQHIEFCNNCRACCQEPGEKRGGCVFKDDMNSILDKIEQADGIVLCSPMNAFTVTAVMKRFIERLLVYCYWPWGKMAGPKPRITRMTKKAVVVGASAMPAVMGRLLVGNYLPMLEKTAPFFGAKVVKTLYFGMAAPAPDWKLPQKQLDKAYRAGQKLI